MKRPQTSRQGLALLLQALAADLENLQAIASKHGVIFENHHRQKLLRFVNILLEWNRHYNLISRADEPNIVKRHILESVGLLVICAPSENSSIMDVGTGGGFPAVPMKILRPDLRQTLVESTGKKARFLKTLAEALGLTEFTVIESRVESIGPNEIVPQSLITARAVAALSTLWRWTSRLLAPGGRLFAIKGGNMSSELSTLRDIDSIADVGIVPFTTWLNIEPSRFVVSIQKKV